MSDTEHPREKWSFSIVVPVLNAMPYLPRVVPALEAAADVADAGIIALDNGSTDGSYEFLLGRANPRLTVRRLPDLTIGQLRNRGAEMSDSELIAFVDSDCVVEADYLARAGRVLDETGAAATGSRYELPTDPGWIESTWHELHRRTSDGWTNYVPSGNLVVRRSAFESVGGFDPQLVTGEDAELCQRLNDADHRVYSSHRVMARHLGNPKTVPSFFRKQYWHGLGMFGTFRRNRLDKVVWLTVLHLMGTLAAVVVAVQGWRGMLAGLALAELAPAAAVGFRWLQLRRPVRPLRSIFLYTVYLWARAAALGAIVFNKMRGAQKAPDR